MPPSTRRLAAALLVLALASPALAAGPEEERGTLSFVLENDIVSGADRDFTNGVLVSWTSPAGAAPDWALDAGRWLTLFSEETSVRVNYGLGQSMYTPNDITLVVPPADDRPYAGWLYASIGLVGVTDSKVNDVDQWLDQLQLQVGVVGPASLAEETQEFVHELVGSDDPQGWYAQLRNEPGFVLTYQRSWRAIRTGELYGLGFDATPHFGAALGNVFTYANAGGTLRLGWNLPDADYGPARVQPSLPGSGYFRTQDRFGAYVFAGFDGRAVARNIFLDGNTWKSGPSVDKETFVGDVQAGVAVTFGPARVTYTHVFRTPEFEGQDGRDEFGALSVSYQLAF